MITLTEDVIKRGKLMGASRGLSFSKLIAELINDNFKVKEITRSATASQVAPNRANRSEDLT